MADNSTLPVNGGTEVFANDDIASVKYPRVKVTWGSDGTATDVDATHQLPVKDQSVIDAISNPPSTAFNGAQTTAMADTTDHAVTGAGAPGSGLRNYITTIVVSNAHATVGTEVVLKDGSGGSVLMTIPAAPAFGGATITLPTPLKQALNTALYAANLTTGAAVKVSVVGFTAA